MSGVQLAIDIALPDEAVAISDLPDIGEQPDAAAVRPKLWSAPTLGV